MAENRIRKLRVQGPAGLYYLSSSELAYATLLKVTRENATQFIVDTTPAAGKPEVQFVQGEGKLIFDSTNPFNFSALNPDGSRIIEYVYILYKRGGAVFPDPNFN